MKRIYLLSFLFSLITIGLHAQTYRNGSINLKSGETVEGRIFLDQSSSTAMVRGGTTYPFSSINQAQIGNRTYTSNTIGGKTYLLYSLVSGKANLYNAGDRNYLLVNGDEAQSIESDMDRTRVRGILLVVFSDCNDIRIALNKEDNFSERNLILFTEQYNSCSYGTFQPTEKELEQANRNNTDQVQFYAGAGISVNNVSFFNSSDTEGLIGGRWVLGIAASPSFLGSIQGNLHFTIEATGSYTGTKEFDNAPQNTELRVNSHQFLLGLDYRFNKTGTFNPLIGIGAGAAADGFKGRVENLGFKIDGGNFIVSPRVGFMHGLNNGKQVGLLVNYVFEYTNDLRFPVADEVILLEVNSQYLNFSLVYGF